MGYIWCLGACASCKIPFTFNPDRVPSVRVNGVKEPICQNCIDRVNPLRVAKGLEPIKPLPGAYEPGDEYESET